MLKLLGRQLQRPRQCQLICSTWMRMQQTTASTETGERLVAVSEALKVWPERLRQNGVGDIDFNLKCIVARVMQKKFNTLSNNYQEQLHFNAAQLAEFERLCEARCARMPLQHIVGEWDFMDLTLKTAPTVFIPRPETEEFVRRVIDDYRTQAAVDMLEVGCGSGAMSLAILNTLPQVKADAIERSRSATALAWENAKMLKLNERFSVHNHTMTQEAFLPDALAGRTYDLIISNPPYIKTEEFQYLQPEVVVYENLNALDGGPDGLRIARVLFDLTCAHLRPGGRLWLEVGNEHPPLVKTIMNLKYDGRLRYISGYMDQYGRERFVEIEKV